VSAEVYLSIFPPPHMVLMGTLPQMNMHPCAELRPHTPFDFHEFHATVDMHTHTRCMKHLQTDAILYPSNRQAAPRKSNQPSTFKRLPHGNQSNIVNNYLLLMFS
jgi:hypothetical protein